MITTLSKTEQKEVLNRREKLFEKLPPDSVGIVCAANKKYRNSHTEYPFRQDSDFYYLSLLSMPEAVLVLNKTKEKNESILFIPKISPSEAMWTGNALSLESAEQGYRVDHAYYLEELEERLPHLLLNKSTIFYTFRENPSFDLKLFSWLENAQYLGKRENTLPDTWRRLNSILAELRVIKSPFEIEKIKEASQISVDAHLALMRRIQPGIKEYELEAEFIYQSGKKGGRFMAYSPIVGSGQNACILHYTDNQDTLKKDDLVLIDAGCEIMGYASDITRTLPISGEFTADQQAIYDLVLTSQEAAIAKIRPGLAWEEIQNTIVSILVPGLKKLGILKGEERSLIEQKAYRAFYMHTSGHWLGLDVHDVGDYWQNGQSRVLEAGMVLTVEPGLYFHPNQDLDPRWWGIGVRIEDDILVTQSGHEVLTQGLPKKVEDLQNILKHSV